MPTIEDLSDVSDPEDFELPDAPPPPPAAVANKPRNPQRTGGAGPGGMPMGMGRPSFAVPPAYAPAGMGIKTREKEEYKTWMTLYPIYLDAKRPHKDGFRRVSKAQALEWPLAEHMAEGCGKLGFETVYEPERSHPKDWENPGRVKVLLRSEDGRWVHPQIKDKRALLKTLSPLLRPIQPRPIPPATLPPIQLRLPPNSPAISHGILESALKGGGMGGMGGMLGNLLGGGGGGGAGDEAKEEEKKPVIKAGPPKVRKIRMKKR